MIIHGLSLHFMIRVSTAPPSISHYSNEKQIIRKLRSELESERRQLRQLRSSIVSQQVFLE